MDSWMISSPQVIKPLKRLFVSALGVMSTRAATEEASKTHLVYNLDNTKAAPCRSTPDRARNRFAIPSMVSAVFPRSLASSN